MTTAAAPDLARWRVLAAFLAAAMVVALLAAVPRWDGLWLVDARAALPAGARVIGTLPVADALLVAAPHVPGGVPADTPVTPHLADLLDVEEAPHDFALPAVDLVGAPAVWATGVKGAGALVAVVDTGVAPVEALDGAVAGEIDFAGSGGGDGYGHGTVVASLIAGSSGVAPDAKVLSLKVADAEGNVTLASLLDALQWLHGPGQHAGVGVVVTALGVPADSRAALMLDRAVERVAHSGPAVIAPTGNDGPQVLTSPATAPAAVGVGATDVDNAPAAFSGSGLDRAGKSKPDVVAPGVYVLGHTPLDGHIARHHPDALRDGGRIRGAGTSLSTALVAGTAALAVSAHADPAKVTDALRLGGAFIDAPALVAATAETAGRTPPGSARRHLSDAVSWNGQGWGDPHWHGATLGGVRWAGVRWAGVRWAGVRWADESWTGVRWAGVRWADESWTGVRWAGVRWADGSWMGVRWAGVRWAATWPEVQSQ